MLFKKIYPIYFHAIHNQSLVFEGLQGLLTINC